MGKELECLEWDSMPGKDKRPFATDPRKYGFGLET
jgi:hypothetical protein